MAGAQPPRRFGVLAAGRASHWHAPLADTEFCNSWFWLAGERDPSQSQRPGACSLHPLPPGPHQTSPYVGRTWCYPVGIAGRFIAAFRAGHSDFPGSANGSVRRWGPGVPNPRLGTRLRRENHKDLVAWPGCPLPPACNDLLGLALTIKYVSTHKRSPSKRWTRGGGGVCHCQDAQPWQSAAELFVCLLLLSAHLQQVRVVIAAATGPGELCAPGPQLGATLPLPSGQSRIPESQGIEPRVVFLFLHLCLQSSPLQWSGERLGLGVQGGTSG